jgi:hypothetical protein
MTLKYNNSQTRLYHRYIEFCTYISKSHQGIYKNIQDRELLTMLIYMVKDLRMMKLTMDNFIGSSA